MNKDIKFDVELMECSFCGNVNNISAYNNCRIGSASDFFINYIL